MFASNLKRRDVLTSILATAVATSTGSARAQDTYPSKTIRLVVPFGAGGIGDVVARLFAQRLGEELGQNVVVDNKTGAGGVVGAQFVSQAAPDGYTLMLGTVGTQVVNPMLYSKLLYDPQRFTPISLLSNSPFMMATRAIPSVKSLGDLITYAKANPGKLNAGSAGNGSSPHLGIELFKLATKTHIVHIPYRSGIEAVNAALADQVQIVIDAIPVVSPHVKSQRLQALVLGATKRNGSIPDVPVAAEVGLPSFIIGAWNCLVAPPGMTADKVGTLNAALARVLEKPEVLARLAELSIEALPIGVPAYESHVRAEKLKWERVVKAAGTRLD